MLNIWMQRQSTLLTLACFVFGISTASKLLSSIAPGGRYEALVNPPVGKILGYKRAAASGTEVYAFTGIPFARPPIGELRYKKPQPAAPWGNDTFDGTKAPPSCMQVDAFIARDLVWVPYGRPKSEDCLYLNIWTPTLSDSSTLPVMAWLHGGEYQVGSAAMHLDDGANLAALGGVVVVTIAYRLQSYGFLYDGTDDAPGNQGLHDQRLALQWIQDNIAAFGGDAAEVTLFGWSAGGIATGFHLLSPESKNLFKRAIMQSGPATKKGRAKDKSLMLGYTNDFAQIFGCSNDDGGQNVSTASLACLRSINASLISAVEETFVDESGGKFEPIFGDEFLPVEPNKAPFPGGKDVIIGHVANEGSILVYKAFRDTFSQILPPRKINKMEMIHFLGMLYTDLPLPDLIELRNLYMENITEYDYRRLRQALSDIKGDEHVVCPTYDTAGRLADASASAEGGNSVYVYKMNYVSACSERRPWFGMSHGDEIPFVFGRPFDGDGGCRTDIPFSTAVINLWSGFAKGRAPTGPNGIERPMVRSGSIEVLNITSKSSAAAANKSASRCKALKELVVY